MNCTFVPMNEAYANEIVNSWKYENEYTIYDYSNEADHMLDKEAWGSGIFAILDQFGELVGELSSVSVCARSCENEEPKEER